MPAKCCFELCKESDQSELYALSEKAYELIMKKNIVKLDTVQQKKLCIFHLMAVYGLAKDPPDSNDPTKDRDELRRALLSGKPKNKIEDFHATCATRYTKIEKAHPKGTLKPYGRDKNYSISSKDLLYFLAKKNHEPQREYLQ
jgi:hypothetical protein